LKASNKYRLVPRVPGDTTPVDPKIAEAMRKAGMDPDKFTLAPFEPGESAPSIAAMFPSGARLEHTFSFDTLNGALSAIERIVDDEVAARISRQGGKWVVVFDAPADPNVPAVTAHKAVAGRLSDLGPGDGGFTHLTMNVTKNQA
jgi:hypothetical protein